MQKQYGGKPLKNPDDAPRTFKVLPLEPKAKRGPGRPPAIKQPAMPDFQWQNDYERELYEAFIADHLADYPNMRASDKLFLPLAAAEYVKCMRLVGNEVASGELVTQARQHPGTMLIRYLDTILATTRKQRVAKGDDGKDDEMDLMKLLGQSPSVA